MLWQLKRTSAFHDHTREPLPLEPHGLEIRDFLDIYAGTASPEEWIALAQDFLDELDASHAPPTS